MNLKFVMMISLMIFSQTLLADKPIDEQTLREPASFSEIQKHTEIKQKDVEKIRELKKDIQKILLTNKI